MPCWNGKIIWKKSSFPGANEILRYNYGGVLFPGWYAMSIVSSSTKGLGRMLLISLVTAFFLISGAGAQAELRSPVTMSVQVAKSQIRSAPSVIAPVIAIVAYREKLNVLEILDGWAKVRVPGSDQVGYLFLVALSNKTIPFTTQEAAAQGVSETEIALAGKGFNQKLEESYRKNSNVDFGWVDFMESFSYDAGECTVFVAGKSPL